MSRCEHAAAQVREALQEAIEWANDLDARLTREAVTLAEVEAHIKIDDAGTGVRAVADRPA